MRNTWLASPLLPACAVGMFGAAWIGLGTLTHVFRRPAAGELESGAAAIRAASPRGELPVLWAVPSFSYIDQDGRQVTQKDLLGRAWVANFIFTQCTSACPLMSAEMVLLQRQVPAPGVRFVSFSVDPGHDTPPVLKDYARRWNGGDPRWLLLSTEKEAILDTAAGLKVSLQNTGDPANPILHSDLFFLVDAEGRVRGFYGSNDDDAMAKITSDLLRLARESPGAAGTAADVTGVAAADAGGPGNAGGQLYASLGCAACHSQSRIAPPLGGLPGGKVKLSDGRVVPADDAYLRESIVDPGAEVVGGYPPLMPSYRGHLSEAQVDQLVAYLHALPASSAERATGTGTTSPAEGPATAPALVIDPVCKMQVHVEADTPRDGYRGKTYYFCSDGCKQRFEKAPSAFVAGAGPTGAARRPGSMPTAKEN